MPNITIRSGGANLVVVYGCILVFLVIGLLGNLSDWFLHRSFDAGPVIAFALCIVVMIVFFTLAFLKQKIEIDGDTLSIASVPWIDSNIPFFRIVPGKARPVTLSMNEIKSVFIGELKTIHNELENDPSQQVSNFCRFFSHIPFYAGGPDFYTTMIINASGATKYMPIMLIRSKDPAKSLVISVKPFSENSIKSFIKAIRLRNIEVSH